MTPLVCMMTRNRWYRSGSTIPMTGIVLHSTGANNPQLRRYVQPTPGDERYEGLLEALGTNVNQNDWNREGQDYGMHAFVGKLADGTVAAVQTLPWDSFLWGCGCGRNGSYNSSHIQIEICEDTTDADYTKQAYWAAAELCAHLCKLFSIPVERIVSHHEAALAGYADTHADPEHWWGRFGCSMAGFREDVQRLLDGGQEEAARYNRPEEIPVWAQGTIQKLLRSGILQGDGAGLDLSRDMLRLLVLLDRAGQF